jgi:ubiquinone/menaquinone biosynthesis C-methylase UbiE
MEPPTVDPSPAASEPERFNVIYASPESPTRLAIFREVYGPDYPEEVAPRSFITMPLLRRLAQSLAVGPGATILDLGCGRAGPSLWVARETGAALVGVDLASVAIAQAAQRAQELGLAARARFEVGDCTALRFAPHTFDAAMSVDVLWMVPDRPAALREVARVLQPGARFAFTNWDRDLAPPGTPPPVPDHRPLLQAAGFVIETYEEIPEAEAQRRAIYERYIASREALHGEIGAAAAEAMLLEARRALGLLDGIDYLRHSRRIFVVARRS